jgi:hypothetical protein
MGDASCAYGVSRPRDNPENVLRQSSLRVEQTDAYVVLLGLRYGDMPRVQLISIIHLEYERARVRGKPSVVFIISPNHRLPHAGFDSEETFPRIKGFRKDIERERSVNRLRSADELSQGLIAELSRRKPLLQGQANAL